MANNFAGENLPQEKLVKIHCPSFLPIGTRVSERSIMELTSKWQQVIEQNGTFDLNRIILIILNKAFNFMQK